MKYILSICIAVAMFVSCGKKHEHSHDHDHDHSEHVHDHSNCTHDHDHDHSSHNHDHDHSHEAKPAHDHGPNAITFTPEQAAKIDFKVAHPEVEPFGKVIHTTAQIQSSTSDEVVISSKSSGIVVFTNNITEGQSVRAGQQLFSISGSGIDNNSTVRFAEAKSNYDKALDQFNRSKELVDMGIVSSREYQEAKTEYEVAKATYENIQANFSEKGQKVNSSKNGFIRQIFVNNGQHVEEGEALFSVSSNNSLVMKADVSPKHISDLQHISGATVKGNDMKVYTLEELNGKVLSYGKTLNSGNYLIPVTFQIDNKAFFVPGSFVEMYIKTESNKQALTVPTTSLTEEQGLFFVYVQLCTDSYEKREVTIGASDGIKTEIRSGLTKEDKVVTRGAMSVKLSQASGALDPHAGHAH